MDVKVSGARRGRPPQTAEEAERVRAHIVAATGEVFTRVGSHGSSVALIIEQAQIARPTFYRYFANAEEPLHVLLSESDDALIDRATFAIESAENEVAMAISVIDAYLDWARAHGPMLRPLFGELYDAASPVSQHREVAIDTISRLVTKKIVDLGRPLPDPLDLDALLNSCAYLVYRVSTTDNSDPETVERARSTMIRIAIATLGQPDDLLRALSVPGVFRAEN
ncbi:TetR/AcrR family transcriptional regulator [Antrihabitans sp. NCIMB 15449]|uniref:TetR/AcrR family transcriptional regulator n=1 Tax=Antrihabitans spumae TaxID=3373370 RepID=A0ABW7JQ22_9NOCA